jgi:hypothetical protein
LIRRIALVPLLVAVLALVGVVRPALAGVSETVMALAGPLAEQFGVPKAAVSTLLDGGLSLDSVTKLLLVSQSSDKGLDDVTKLFNASGKDIDKTAGELDVKPDAYSTRRSPPRRRRRRTRRARAPPKRRARPSTRRSAA